MPNHFQQLQNAFRAEWAGRPQHAYLEGANLEYDGARFFWVYDAHGDEIIRWECRNFPGCASLIITTKVELRQNLRGQGLGRYFRELRHRAYKRAGFVGEIATVRTDNDPQNRLMVTMGATKMGEFPSDFGGAYALWLTKLSQTQPEARPVITMTAPPPPRAPIPAAPPLPMPPPADPVAAQAAEERYQAFVAPPHHRKVKVFAHRRGL